MSFHNLRIDKFSRAPLCIRPMNFPYLHFLPGHFAGQARQCWMVPLQFELGPLALVGPITVGLGPTALSSSPKNVEWPNVESIFFPLLWLRKKCRIRKMLHRHFFLFVIKEKMSSQKKCQTLTKNVNLQFENESEIFLMFQTILNMNVTISCSMMNIYSMRMKQWATRYLQWV